MKILNRILKVGIFCSLLFVLISFSEKNDNSPKIENDTVKSDVLSHDLFLVPLNYIKEDAYFVYYYLGDYCLVHIPYYPMYEESNVKCSLIAIYHLVNNKWIFQNTIPYYRELEMIDSQSRLFISKNSKSGLMGEWSSYTEICYFDNEGMKKIEGYNGYEKMYYYNALLSREDTAEIKSAIGDTIGYRYELTNFKIEDNKLTAYDIITYYTVLEELSKSLVIRIDSSNICEKAPRYLK
ncbi:MAG: hypothetical protein JXB49_01250 [Bacteroidales bacterium]|nr:hypothetical protein [Bacteroidales bacterium]